jgi:hypothetical protein
LRVKHSFEQWTAPMFRELARKLKPNLTVTQTFRYDKLQLVASGDKLRFARHANLSLTIK